MTNKTKKAIKKSRNIKRKNKKVYTMKKNKKQKKRKIKKNSCAPKKKGEYLQYSCYTPSVLFKMRDLWNKRHPDVKIKDKSPKKIWEKLGYYMKDTCDREACWIKNNIFKEGLTDNEISNLFSPKSPNSWKTNKNTWLTSMDIVKVMKQYENAYHCFEFIGPSPIDFDSHYHDGECVWKDLCKFNLSETLKRKKRKIGIIFNLDPHYKSGSHWVAMFINTNNREIIYFDSYGDPAPTEIRKFARKVQNQSINIDNGEKYKYLYNKMRHQYGNSECGIYSLYFIINLLKDTSKSFIDRRILDKKMENLRKRYFNI